MAGWLGVDAAVVIDVVALLAVEKEVELRAGRDVPKPILHGLLSGEETMSEVVSEEGGLTCIVRDNSGTNNYYASPCSPTSEREAAVLELSSTRPGTAYSGTPALALYTNAGQSDGFLNHHCAVMHPANLTVLDEPADMPVMPCASINWTSADGIEPGIR